MSENIEQVLQIRTLNGQALHNALRGEYSDAYQSFMQANDASIGLDEGHPEVVMASADTLRDWAFTYARDAAKTSDAALRKQLFEASDFLFDRTLAVTDPMLTRTVDYTTKMQRIRLENTHFVAHSVRARAHHLRKVVTAETWGDEPDFGIANGGLNASYYSVTNSAHALSYIRAKDTQAQESIHNSKSTRLHMIPWIGRAVRQLALTPTAAIRQARDEQINLSLQPNAKRSLKEELIAVKIGAFESLRAMAHVGRIALSLRSKTAARETIRQYP